MKRLFLVLAAGLLMACGGSGGTSSPPPPISTESCEGLWSGTVTATGTTLTADAVILGNGEFHFSDSVWALAKGTTAPAGASPITGSGTMYAPIGYIFKNNGANSYGFSLSAKVINGALVGSFGGGDSGTFTFTRRPDYQGAVDLSRVAGTYTSTVGSMSNKIPFTVALAPDGAFSAHDNNGGTFSGRLTPVDPAKNAFRVTMTYTTNEHRDYPLSGMAFFILSGPSPLVLIQGTGTSGGFGGLFTKTGP